ncbi:hypothetical protein Q8F55_007713 [Vanrija albida]|uniref:DUF6534 domain-containing protein n=1 Tax=Vanrija albida TaxID=181172 RepID=A0ABR3PUA9_9TREE
MIPLVPRHEAAPVGNATTAAEIYAPVKASPISGRAHTQAMNLSLLWAGMLLNCFLTGVFTFQLVWCGAVYRKDKAWVKGVVLFIAAMAFGNFFFLLYWAWWTIVADYGEYTHFLAYMFLSIFVLLDSATTAVIQAFFTYRTWRLNNRNWYLVVLLTLLISMGFGSGLAQAAIVISFSIHQDIFSSLPRLDPISIRLFPAIVAWNVGSMGADLVITVSILWGLWRTRTGWDHSDKVIARLARMTLEAQTPPLLMAVVFTATYITLFPHGLGAYINNSKLSCIGLMYSLNSRQGFVRQNLTVEQTPGGPGWASEQVKTAPGERTTMMTVPDSDSTTEARLPAQSVAYGLREDHMLPHSQ